MNVLQLERPGRSHFGQETADSMKSGKCKLPGVMALALLGWYLMAPAEPRTLYDEVAPPPPLSKWQQLDVFDTARECKQTLQDRVAQWLKQGRSGSDREYEMEQITCVASDDPRLAK